MTADAKVGLLLGLFFIVVIAFLVNGLPNFIHQENPSPPDVAIITPTGPDMPLDNRVSDAVHRLYPSRDASRTKKHTKVKIAQDMAPVVPAPVEIPDAVLPPQTPVVNDPPVQNPVTVESPKAQTHVAKSGEDLSVIAKIYYGKEDGNRRIVIQKLYEANTSVLKSPDRVCVGDKLVIPSLDELLGTSNKVVRAPDPSQTLLDKFTNVLERVGSDNSKSISEYIVQEGDSLWAIAKTKLGDGKRYADILRLNKDKIKSADDVAAGTRLKLPSQ